LIFLFLDNLEGMNTTTNPQLSPHSQSQQLLHNNPSSLLSSSPSKIRIARPTLSRQQSLSLENYRMAIAEIISQIR
jgi:hypothetical protein